MAEDYIYFKPTNSDPTEGTPIEIRVTNRATREELRVRAILSRSPESFPEGDRLWLQKWSALRPEDRPDNPWHMKIVETIPEEAPEVEVKKTRISLGARGDMIRSLLREQEEKEKKSGS